MLRTLFAASALISGCMPFAYPEPGFTPSVTLDAPPGEVRAFRVDLPFPFMHEQVATLHKLPVAESGRVPMQFIYNWRVGAVYAVPVYESTGRELAGNQIVDSPPQWNWHPGLKTESFPRSVIMLYRPGYRPVRVQRWLFSQPVEWELVPDVCEQEQFVDALIMYGKVAPVKDRPAHAQALLYAASEYERIAGLVEHGPQQERLLANAQKVRRYASGQ